MLNRALPLALWVGLLTSGCPQEVRPLLDGGLADAGAGGDVGPADAGAGADAGALDGGGLDAGLADAGDPTPGLRWSSLTLPANTRTIVAVWGRSATEVYFGTTSGYVYRFDGAAFTELWRVPNNFGVKGIGGTATRVFVAGERNLYVFDGAPSSAGPAETHAAGHSIGGLHVVADDLAFVVSERTSRRGLYRYGVMGVVEVVPSLDVASVNGVWAEPGPQVWVAGNGRFPFWDGLGVSEAPATWPAGWSPTDIAYFFVYDIAGVGGSRLAVGSGGGVMSDATGTWTFERMPEGSEDFEAVAPAFGPRADAIAVGDDVDGATIHWRTPEGWRPDPLRERVSLLDVWAAGPDEVFAVGGARGSFDGVVLRGTR